MLTWDKPDPGIFTDTDINIITNAGIAEDYPTSYYRNDKTGKLMIRGFLISDKHPNNQDWEVRNLDKYVRTFIGRPNIITPGFHHVGPRATLEEWLKVQEPFGFASMTDTVYNPKFGVYDYISEVFDEDIAQAIESGEIKIPKYNSPAIWGVPILERRGDKTIRVFNDWVGVHSAVVKSPAFDPEIAQINPQACRGDILLCRDKLAAIAESSYNQIQLLKENYHGYISPTPQSPHNGGFKQDMSDPNQAYHDLNKKLQEENLKLQTNATTLGERNTTLEETLKKEREQAKALIEERDNLKSKVTSYESLEAKNKLRTELDVKLSKTKQYYKNVEARSKKVDELVEKNIPIDAIDTIYEGMFYTDDEIKAMSEEGEPKPDDNGDGIKPDGGNMPSPQGGIASSSSKYTGMQTDGGTKSKKLAAINLMNEIMELRL